MHFEIYVFNLHVYVLTCRKKLRVVVHKDVEGLVYYLDKVVMVSLYAESHHCTKFGINMKN